MPEIEMSKGRISGIDAQMERIENLFKELQEGYREEKQLLIARLDKSERQNREYRKQLGLPEEEPQKYEVE
jgi:hypothetical protein